MRIFYLIIIVLSILSSCKTVKLVAKKKPIGENKTVFFDSTRTKYLVFETFSAKINSKLDFGEQKNSVSANLRIRKDSCIWMSVSPALGIEAFRILITEDSIKFIDRLHTTYFSGDYKFIEKSLNLRLNYDMIQSILLDEFFKYENDFNVTKDIRDFYFETDTNMNFLQNISKEELKEIKKGSQARNYLLQKFYINPKTQKIVTSKVEEKILDRELNVHYSDFQEVGSVLFPNEVLIKIKNAKDNAEISLKYSKITLDKDLQYPFNISKKYQKIEQ